MELLSKKTFQLVSLEKASNSFFKRHLFQEYKSSCGEIVNGAERNGDHSTRKAYYIVRHAKVWSW